MRKYFLHPSCLILCGLFFATSLQAQTFDAMVFSKTSGFRHDSIDEGIQAIQTLASANNFSVVATEDANQISDAGLQEIEVVIFLHTTGDFLNSDQEQALERFLNRGGGWVGIHAAADAEYDWAWYGGLVGAYFNSHPQIQEGDIKILDHDHPSTANLPLDWTRTDEWYNFTTNPRGDVHVLATLTESSYFGGNMGADHPIAWCHDYQGGRSWYTAGGHTEESFSEAGFLDHIYNGIAYAAGALEGDCGATVNGNYEIQILDDDTRNPMDLDVTPDGRVIYLERTGEVQIYDPSVGSTVTAGQLDVFNSNEDGLLGIAVDPDFANNNWIYLFYSPQGNEEKQHISRFTLQGNTLDLNSEILILEFPLDRGASSHSGGALTFGPDGLLYISSGDNTTPFDSDGYAPIDERSGRLVYDAQRSSGNTNDLRGKILRIKVEPDGSYSIPPGNLFAPGTANARPEIYVMGARNPFTMTVDSETGWLYFGDIGPDAGNASGARGPAGLDEWNQVREAGNYGWPYCSGNNQAYKDYNFASNTAGNAFNCDSPRNTSPNNTGLSDLPSAKEAWIWYPYGDIDEWPEIGNGARTAMAGPVYHFDQNLDSDAKLPKYYDDSFLIYEWSRNWIKEVQLNETGGVHAIVPFADHLTLLRPISMKLGPDGALYLAEWGTGFGGNNADSRIIKIAYAKGARTPISILNADPSSGPVPLSVQFTGSNSFDPDPGDSITFSWDLDGDGNEDSTDPDPSFVYNNPGTYEVLLRVTDSSGKSSSSTITITAGNTMPVMELSRPVEGGFFDWGDFVDFETGVSDDEDGSTAAGTIDCSAVNFQPFLGHDDHTHPLDLLSGCEGVFQIATGHGADEDKIFYVVESSYTDQGVSGSGTLTGRALHVLRPKRLQAEHYDGESGILLENAGDVLGGGENIAFIDHGDWVMFTDLNLTKITHIRYRVASAGAGGYIEVRVGSPTGRLISRTGVEPTGDWQVYRDMTVAVDDPGGANDLYFLFVRDSGDTGLFNVNWIDFLGKGVSNSDAVSTGLNATYFDNIDLTNPIAQRIDPVVNFNWAMRGPIVLPEFDTFSVRWEGFITPTATAAHTFITRNDDGLRLFVNNELIIDDWNNHAVEENRSSPISLDAGTRYPIVLEYYDDGLDALVDLSWAHPSLREQIIPTSALTPLDVTVSNENEIIPSDLELDPVYPNPSQGIANYTFRIPDATLVRLNLYDGLGRIVKEFQTGVLQAGAHSGQIELDGFSNGSYWLVLETDAGKRVTRMTVVR